MSTRTDEEMIRQALERQAGRAVSPDRIRAALPALSARRARQRRARAAVVAVAAAVAVGATVAVPMLGLAREAPPEPSVAAPSATAVAAQPAATVALRYRPTWLPPGFTERSRSGSAGAAGSVTQVWTKEPKGVEPYSGGRRIDLSVESAPADRYGTFGTRVDVNGRTGYLVGTPGDGDKSYLHWMPDNATVLNLHLVDYQVSKADFLKMARSVRPTTAVLKAPLRAGWLPDSVQLAPALSFDGDSKTFWRATLDIRPSGKSSSPDPSGSSLPDPSGSSLPPEALGKLSGGQDGPSGTLSVGTLTDAPPGGEPMTVGGRPARFVAPGSDPPLNAQNAYVVVDLGRGLLLTARAYDGSLDRATLTRIAERTDVDPRPDLSWVGSR